MFLRKEKNKDSSSSHSDSDGKSIVDNRSEAVTQHKLQDVIDNSPQVAKTTQLQSMIDNSPLMVAQRKANEQLFGNSIQKKKDKEEENPVQKKENKTGMPDDLKSGMENLSGMSMDDVKVHYNSSKPAEVQAHAYAQGTDIHLGAGQEKHLPHEAWHVVQQKQGRVQATKQMKGVAVNDDSGLEKEADVMGLKAKEEKQLKPIQKMAINASSSVLQKYSKFTVDEQNKGKSLGWKNPSSADISVAEDGTLASRSHTKQAWAEAANINASNQILKDRNSAIRLEVGSGQISGTAPNDSSVSKKLSEVKVKSDTGGTAKLTADCGTAAQEGVGIKNNKFTGVTREKGTENYTNPSDYRGGSGINSTTGDMEGEIYKRILKNEFSKDFTNNLDAMNAFYKLDKAEQDRISKKYGMNAYARAKVGQGLTIGTDKDVTGFDYRGASAWNFHFATTIFNSKDDDMTIENFAGNSGGDTGWYFVLLGPASKKQDFHYHNGEELGGHGDKYTTLVVENSASIFGEVNADKVHLVGDPAKYDIIEKLSLGTKVKTTRKGNNWRKVEITSGPSTGKEGWIMNKYFKN